jgi:hypothetical protein
MKSPVLFSTGSTRSRLSRLLQPLAFLAALFAATVAFAGPPLICHPYEIGQAKTLPTGNTGHGTSATYDRTALVADTLALLAPDTPVLVRMETMRRAAIYATGNLRAWSGQKYTAADKDLALQLIAKLRERTTTGASAAKALALFDLGFFSETIRQTELLPDVQGYDLIVKARELRGPDAEMEFALAVASHRGNAATHAEHLARARAAAQPNSLLAANLTTHFGKS